MSELKSIWSKFWHWFVFEAEITFTLVFLGISVVVATIFLMFFAYSVTSHSNRSLCLKVEETRRWHSNSSWYQRPVFVCEEYIDGGWVEVDPKKDNGPIIYHYNNSHKGID